MGRAFGSTSIVALSVTLVALLLLANYGTGRWSQYNDMKAGPKQLQGEWTTKAEQNKDSDTYNQTLGFEKVLAVNSPGQSDKKATLTRMSALTEFNITWLAGVNEEEIQDSDLLLGSHRRAMKNVDLSSWHGHLNAMETITKERLSSALIMENDVDWDARLKKQLYHLSTAALELQHGPWQHDAMGPGEDSPYGKHWDLLWLGTCGTTFQEHLAYTQDMPPEQRDYRKVLLPSDPTVPPEHQLTGNRSFSWTEYPPHTRIVFVPGVNECSHAYALSYAGAKKALQYLGLVGKQRPFDSQLADLCRLRVYGMRCVGVTPGLFARHTPRSDETNDFDADHQGSGRYSGGGYTENILYSTRLKLQDHMTGNGLQKQQAD